MMKKNIQKAEDTNVENKNEIAKQQNEIQTLNQLQKSKTETLKAVFKELDSTKKEKEKLSMDASKANVNLMQMVEEVKLKKNLISELKKENIEFEYKLKQQQNLYEAVRSERNLYSKNLIEAQDEVAELKRKFKIASH
jgi:predicted  nucleic acid-binding Zn-ribbon protein